MYTDGTGGRMMNTTLLNRVRVAAVAVATALVAALVPLDSSVAAASVTVMYERTAYDGTIWEVTTEGAYALSYEEWSSLGFPAFTPADTEYVRAAPFNTVYAITWFELAEAEWTDFITYPQYVAAGSPLPTVVPWIDGIEVHKWPTASELFGTDPAGSIVKLTYEQWSEADFPVFVNHDNRGFFAMSWDGSGAIAYMCDLAGGRGGRLSFDQWTSLGSPTPLRVNRTAADFVHKVAGSSMPTVFYSGPIVKAYPLRFPSGEVVRALNYSEWQRMGSPAPLITNITYPENWYCTGPDPSPWQ